MPSISVSVTSSRQQLPYPLAAGTELTMSIFNPFDYNSYIGLESTPDTFGYYSSLSPKVLSGSIISSSGVSEIVQDDYKMLAIVRPGTSTIVYKPTVYVSGSNLYTTGINSKEKFYYVFTINTANTSSGSTGGGTFKLPLVAAGAFTASVDWGDGVVNTISSSAQTEVTHVYPATGSYLVRIIGPIRGWKFNSTGDRLKLTNILSWGDFVITEVNAFTECRNLESVVSDTPTVATSSLALMFSQVLGFNGYINDWDVSSVTNFQQFLHSYNTASLADFAPGVFNQPLNKWNTSKVTNMSLMFTNQTRFNQDISMWDVSKVTTFHHFLAAYTEKWPGCFNQNLNNWDVSSATTIRTMFQQQVEFNQPLDRWNTSNVSIMDFTFGNAQVFNQPLNTWNTSNVTTMRFTFTEAYAFNQPLSNWNTSKVTNMLGTFSFATSFNQDISMWDVSKVVNFEGTFASASRFNQDISNWNVSSAVSMSYMFENAESFDQNLGSWDVRNVKYMTGMFDFITLSTENYDGILNGWNSLPTLQTGVVFSGGNSKYSPAASASRSNLISTYGWTITDGGPI